MDGEQQIRKAYQSILAHDFERAIEWFEQAIARDPDNAAYHYKLSITYARSGKLSKALGQAEAAVQLDPGRKEYKFHLQNLRAKELVQTAEKCFQQSPVQLHLAVSLLKKAVTLDPLAAEAFFLLGMAYGALEEYGPGIEAMNEVLKLNPGHETAGNIIAEYKTKLKTYLWS